MAYGRRESPSVLKYAFQLYRARKMRLWLKKKRIIYVFYHFVIHVFSLDSITVVDRSQQIWILAPTLPIDEMTPVNAPIGYL